MKFFTYGTFKTGQCRNHALVERGGRFLGPAITARDAYSLVDHGAYPAVIPMLPGYGGIRIKGELFEVPDDALPYLDWVEGYPDLYEREEVEVVTEAGTFTAWMYYMPRGEEALDGPLCTSGEWPR